MHPTSQTPAHPLRTCSIDDLSAAFQRAVLEIARDDPANTPLPPDLVKALATVVWLTLPVSAQANTSAPLLTDEQQRELAQFAAQKAVQSAHYALSIDSTDRTLDERMSAAERIVQGTMTAHATALRALGIEPPTALPSVPLERPAVGQPAA